MAKEKTPEALLKGFIIATLRRASYRWPERTKALGRARVERGVYKCESCGYLGKKNDMQLDHVLPIVPIDGWDTWDGYIKRLFCQSEGFAVLCRSCHSAKSATEARLRKIKRQEKKELDKSENL